MLFLSRDLVAGLQHMHVDAIRRDAGKILPSLGGGRSKLRPFNFAVKPRRGRVAATNGRKPKPNANPGPGTTSILNAASISRGYGTSLITSTISEHFILPGEHPGWSHPVIGPEPYWRPIEPLIGSDHGP